MLYSRRSRAIDLRNNERSGCIVVDRLAGRICEAQLVEQTGDASELLPNGGINEFEIDPRKRQNQTRIADCRF